MRITPSISLSWTIEREIDSEECREDEDPQPEDPQPEDPDPPNFPNRPEIPEEILGKCSDQPKLYGWYLVEVERTSSTDNAQYWGAKEIWKSDENSIWVDSWDISLEWSSSDSGFVPFKEKYWLLNPSKKPFRNRTVYNFSDNCKFILSWNDGNFICYDEAKKFDPNNPEKPGNFTTYFDFFPHVQGGGGKAFEHTRFTWNENTLNKTPSGRWCSTYGYADSYGMKLYHRISSYKYRISLYPPEEINPPDPLPEIGYPKMKKNCCSDPKLMKMVKEIYDVLDPKEIKKSAIPRRFLAIDGEGTEKLKTYNEIFQALFLMLDKQGYIPFGVRKETADGDEIVLDFKHQSQALQAIIGHLINMDQDTQETEQIKELDRKYSEVTARLALAITQLISTSVHTNEMVYSILQFLGFRTNDTFDEVPISLDPIGLKEFSQIDKQSEGDPDEFNRKVMAVLFSDSKLKVPAIKLNDQKTLQALFLELKTLMGRK